MMIKFAGKPSRLVLLVALAATALALSLFPAGGDTVPAVAGVRFPGRTLVIDPGHGGEDGGAVSVTGVPESGINLSIALRLDDLMGFYGVNTLVLRTEDVSLHDPEAQTLRQKKTSDLRNRVAAVEALDHAVLISIHQNTFDSPRYRGAQVFYADGVTSMPLAQAVQDALRGPDPDNARQPAKIPESVYLMHHITCPAVLVECGFLSNPVEDALLQTPAYQTKLALAMAGGYLTAPELPEERNRVSS